MMDRESASREVMKTRHGEGRAWLLFSGLPNWAFIVTLAG